MGYMCHTLVARLLVSGTAIALTVPLNWGELKTVRGLRRWIAKSKLNYVCPDSPVLPLPMHRHLSADSLIEVL